MACYRVTFTFIFMECTKTLRFELDEISERVLETGERNMTWSVRLTVTPLCGGCVFGPHSRCKELGW